MTKPSRWLIVAGLLTIYLVWGSTYLAIRVAVETLPPFLMAGARFLVAGSLVAAILLVTQKFRATYAQWVWNAGVGCLMLLGGNGLVSWAEQTIPSGIATLIVSFNPLMMVFAEWCMYRATNGSKGAKPNALVFLGLSVGIVGLGLLVGPSMGTNGGVSYDMLRIGAIVMACFTWTVGSMMTRYAKTPVDPFTGSAIQMLWGGVWLVLCGTLLGEWSSTDWNAITTGSFVAWLYLVVAGSLIAFTTFVWLMKHTSPTLISTYAYVNPVVAVLLGWIVLNESLDSWTLFSAAIIVAGVALITIGKGLKKSERSNDSGLNLKKATSITSPSSDRSMEVNSDSKVSQA
ncbi:MAG: EamA family transporter [Pirellulales bacterium]